MREEAERGGEGVGVPGEPGVDLGEDHRGAKTST